MDANIDAGRSVNLTDQRSEAMARGARAERQRMINGIKNIYHRVRDKNTEQADVPELTENSSRRIFSGLGERVSGMDFSAPYQKLSDALRYSYLKGMEGAGAAVSGAKRAVDKLPTPARRGVAVLSALGLGALFVRYPGIGTHMMDFGRGVGHAGSTVMGGAEHMAGQAGDLIGGGVAKAGSVKDTIGSTIGHGIGQVGDAKDAAGSGIGHEIGQAGLAKDAGGQKIGEGIAGLGAGEHHAQDAVGATTNNFLNAAGATKDNALSGVEHVAGQGGNFVGEKVADTGAAKDEALRFSGNTLGNVGSFIGDKVAGAGNIKDQTGKDIGNFVAGAGEIKSDVTAAGYNLWQHLERAPQEAGKLFSPVGQHSVHHPGHTGGGHHGGGIDHGGHLHHGGHTGGGTEGHHGHQGSHNGHGGETNPGHQQFNNDQMRQYLDHQFVVGKGGQWGAIHDQVAAHVPGDNWQITGGDGRIYSRNDLLTSQINDIAESLGIHHADGTFSFNNIFDRIPAQHRDEFLHILRQTAQSHDGSNYQEILGHFQKLTGDISKVVET